MKLRVATATSDQQLWLRLAMQLEAVRGGRWLGNGLSVSTIRRVAAGRHRAENGRDRGGDGVGTCWPLGLAGECERVGHQQVSPM